VWFDDFILVKQSQAARYFKHTLDNEHYVGAARVILVKHNRDVVFQCPWQNSVAELGDLLAVFDHDGVFANQVDPADMTVQVNPHEGPVQPSCNLLNVRRFTRAVITLHHDASVVLKARKNGERCGLIK